MTDEQWEQLKQLIWNAEQSGGDYTSHNTSSGAAGAYQFMPETWREKANTYGYGEYADVPNATYAPSYVQDSVARGWATDLYEKYNGDVRYVLDAWISGEGAADADYEAGIIPSDRTDGNISVADYVARGLDYQEELPTAYSLDTAYVTTNNPDQNVTNTERLRPESIYGANTLGYYMMSNFNVPLLISGGAELGYHAKSSTGHGHEDGWKIDVANSQIMGNTMEGAEFKKFCNSQGWSCNWEEDHWDIDFSGQDARDPQRGGYTGNFFGETFSSMKDDYGFDYVNFMMNVEHDELTNRVNNYSTDVLTPSFWDKVTTGFMDGLTTTGTAYVMQSLWGNLMHSNNHFGAMDKVTQEDIDYVKNALPNDEEAQRFALLNGRDSEEIRWLVNQKLVDKQRAEKIAQFNDGCTLTVANAARLIGGMVDPTMLIPVGTAFNGAKVVAKLGNAVYDVSKVARVAGQAARVGLVNAGTTVANDALREKFGGINLDAKEYGWNAAVAGVGGAVLGALGGLISRNARTPEMQHVANIADSVETKAIRDTVGLDITRIKNETIGEALKIHDVNYGSTIKSKYYSKLESNNKVIATTFEKAKALVENVSGIKIPSSAKAFYVPNEDYTILLTDKLKSTEVDNVLAHELGVHAGLRNLVGEKDYQKLMDDVSNLANKSGHVFNNARRAINDYNPEEILAYAVENDMLPKGIISSVKGMVNRGLKREGLSTKITTEQVRSMMVQQLNAERNLSGSIQRNPDGSTAFAGILYSKDSFLNPQLFADFYTLEPTITRDTQKDLPKFFPKAVGKMLEQGVFGQTYNSAANSLRGIAPSLWNDVRGRGSKGLNMMSAETNKERLTHLLAKPYLEYASIRNSYCLRNKQMGHAAHMAFDKLVTLAYNSKHAGSKSNVPQDFPDEVWQAVENIKALRDKQIELGKRSATDVGSTSDNFIEQDWEAVDHELWRVVDVDQRIKFTNRFASIEEAEEALATYYKKAAKRDVVKAKIKRSLEKENKKIQEYNSKITEGSKRQPQELKDTNVTDDMVETWLDEHVPQAVRYILRENQDVTLQEGKATVGVLTSLKERIPIDTSLVLKADNGYEFSFDNDLRSFDLDSIIQKNISRFAGEASFKNVFNTQKDLDNFMIKVKKELDKAVEQGVINKSTAESDYKVFEQGLNELRGMRPHVDALSRLGALARIFSKLAYAKNGANMMFAQLGELGGAMAYGGLHQVFNVFKPLGKLVDDVRLGKVTNEALKEAEETMFGETIESKIFTVNWNDRVTRDALTQQGSIINKALIMANDYASNLGKITSAINTLPHMTDNMVRGMRRQTILDVFKWANGKQFSKLRNPFSKAKLKASGINEELEARIKENMLKYSKAPNGVLEDINAIEWQRNDPISFAKFYDMVQTQAERAIVSGSRVGNKNLFKDKNIATQLLFQFKDYALRAINAQTFRAMTARDVDDALAALLSIVTNTAAYVLKAGATWQLIKATGGDEKAKEYYDKYLNEDTLLRVAAFRSSIVGTPFSFVNDLLEGSGIVDTSIRTSVNRGSYGSPDSVGDYVGNIVAQTPALQQATAPLDVLNYFYRASNNEANKSDFRKALQALPIPQWLPITTFINNYIVEPSEYPTKRPKSKGE